LENLSQSSRPPTILVVLLHGIGDQVQALPLIRELKRVLPTASLCVAQKPGRRCLLNGVEVEQIVEVITASDLRNAVRGSYFNLIIDAADEVSDENYLPSLEAIPHGRLVGFTFQSPSNDGETVYEPLSRRVDFTRRWPYWQQILSLLRLVDIESSADPPQLPVIAVSAAAHASVCSRWPWIQERATPLIGFAIGGLIPRKLWPIRSYQELAGRLSEEYEARIVVLGDEPYRDDTAQRPTEGAGGLYDLTSQTSLSEAIAVIGALDLLVCNDTGLMHIAGALDVPVVAVYSDPGELVFQPMGSQYTLIAPMRPGIANIPCGEVFDACQRYLHGKDNGEPRMILLGRSPSSTT
jgi:ADP-heptose:LPS heptosyltransferase